VIANALERCVEVAFERLHLLAKAVVLLAKVVLALIGLGGLCRKRRRGRGICECRGGRENPGGHEYVDGRGVHALRIVSIADYT
jgi:hypothetical protein